MRKLSTLFLLLSLIICTNAYSSQSSFTGQTIDVAVTGEYTSFYETSGPRKGYVKGSQKIWERLLISWWALDWRVGEDKKLGRDTSVGNVFHTSIKPWAREESDLRDVPRFLKYWGWRL